MCLEFSNFCVKSRLFDLCRLCDGGRAFRFPERLITCLWDVFLI